MRSLMKNLFTSPMRNPTAEDEGEDEDDYIFEMQSFPGDVLRDSITGVPAVTSISGVRYGIVNGAVTQFAVNQPPIEDDGLRGCPAFTQYFLNNEAPVTQSITLTAGSYCLWIEGSGSATFNGLTATVGDPKVFTLASSFTGNCVIAGTVTKAMINSGLFIAPFSPTQGVTKSFVSEAATATTGTSFDLDDVKLAKLKSILRGPNAQGHLELTFKSNVDSGWLANNTYINFLSLNDSVTRGIYFLKETAGVSALRTFDGTNAIIFPHALTVGQSFKISLDWGTHPTGQKMRITVNGVKSALVNFSGSFGTQDLRFFLGNTVHAGNVKDIKVSDRPQW